LVGLIYRVLNQHAQSIEYHTRAQEMFNQVYPKPHQNMMSNYINMANTYRELGDMISAINYYNRVISFHGNNKPHPHVARCLYNQSICWKMLGKNDKAKTSLEKALALYKKVLGGDLHPEIAQIHNGLGKIYSILNKQFDAIGHFTEAINIYKNLNDPTNNIIYAESLFYIAKEWENINKEQAKVYYKESYEIYKKELGETDPTTINSKNRLEYCEGGGCIIQ